MAVDIGWHVLTFFTNQNMLMLKKTSFFTTLGVLILLQIAFKTIAQEGQFECNSESINLNSFGSPMLGNISCFGELSVEEINEMPIATLKVDFYFIKSNGNNFQCSDPSGLYYAPTYVTQILDYANDLASNPAQNQFGTSPDLIDTRIRYKLSSDPANPCDAIFILDEMPTTFSNPNAFHVIVSDNGRKSVGGQANSITMNLFNIHYFIFEVGWPNASNWGNVIHHEFGHIFGLCHAFSALNDISDMSPFEECGGPSETICGIDPCPVIAPGTTFPGCGDNHCYSCYCTWGTGNNFMGYTAPQIGVTRQQWAQMYGSIYSDVPIFATIDRNCAVKTYDPLIIPAGQFVEWDKIKFLTQPLIVETGATLVIRCEVKVSEELTILVKRGARLILEGGKITSATPECKWAGIYVLGNTSLPQPAIADAQNYFSTIPLDGAGVVWINGGIIENAVTGIHTLGFGTDYSQSTFGGLVMVNSSDFINNGRAIEFMKYNFPNKSYLKDVDIILSGLPTWAVNRGVSIWACSDIKFEDVRFEGISDYDIYGINFTAQVKHCSFKNLATNNFTKMYGFRSENTAPNIQPNSSTIIDDSDFELIKNDVYFNSTPNMIYPILIKNCRFKKKPTSGLRGIRIGGDAKYTIGAGNEFNNKFYAIQVYATGSLLNSIDCNFFGELEAVTFGVTAAGKNDGLEITGNDFLEQTSIEINVTPNSSIHETQGKLTEDVDNCFFNPLSAIRATNLAAPFLYYVFDLTGNPVFCEKPTNNLSDGGVNNYKLVNSSTERPPCDYSRPGVTPSDLIPARQNTYAKKAIWQADTQNEQKRLDYLTAKDWQAYVLRTL
ncbi:MAG: hypothetical protein KA138_08280, partial [Saprospiraceae bacterium]|nr:hypothetical protein [Saprospiraceae bacterium]